MQFFPKSAQALTAQVLLVLAAPISGIAQPSAVYAHGPVYAHSPGEIDLIPDNYDLSALNPAFILTGPQYRKAFLKGEHEYAQARRGGRTRIGFVTAGTRRKAHDRRGRTSSRYLVSFYSLDALDAERDGYASREEAATGRFSEYAQDRQHVNSFRTRGTAYVSLSFFIHPTNPAETIASTLGATRRAYTLTDDQGATVKPNQQSEGWNDEAAADCDAISFPLFNEAGKPLISRSAKVMTLHIISGSQELSVDYRLEPPRN